MTCGAIAFLELILLLLVVATGALSARVGHWWPLAAVLLAGANQVFPSLFERRGPTDARAARVRWLRWVSGLVFAYLLFNGTPALGGRRGGGIQLPQYGWESLQWKELKSVGAFAPYRVMAFGFLYYLTAGCLELTRRRRAPSS